MKGDIVNVTRVTAFRLALAALILSFVAMGMYLAGNIQELSDSALLITVNWAVGASIAGIILAILAGASGLLGPLFSTRISLLTFFASLLVIAANLAILLLASTIKAVTGGLSL